MHSMALLHEKTQGRDPGPAPPPSHSSGFVSVEIDGAGTWELGLLKMGFASEFSASGFALIIGYLQAVYLGSNTLLQITEESQHVPCWRSQKNRRRLSSVWDQLVVWAESGPDTCFTAGEEIITTSPNSPCLLLSLFLSIVTQIAPRSSPPSFFFHGVNKHFL